MDNYYFCKDTGLTEFDLMDFADMKHSISSMMQSDALQSLQERKYGGG